MAKWKYVLADGNPKTEGLYWVTLLYEGTSYDPENGWKFTGKKCAVVTQRYLADVSKNKEMSDWKMNDQPDEGLVWVEESSSIAGERVWAWLPHEEVPIAVLPEGYEYVKD